MRYNKIRNGFACQCKCGNVFDFKNAVPYNKDDYNDHPGLLKCPYCKSNNWSFIGNSTNIYPIKFNYNN